mgnify:CR=1 FL=1
MRYIALIGDLIHSRRIEDRLSVQEHIKKVFSAISTDYSDCVVSRLTLTLGDEFQALLKPDKEIFLLLDDLEYRLGLPFRSGLGYGTLLTEIDPKISIGADGEAFWNARSAIENVREKSWGGRSRVRIEGLAERQEVVNALFLLSDAIKLDWTQLQKETFGELLKRKIYSESFEQKSLAEDLSISQSSLSKRLSSSGIKLYLHARNVLGEELEAWHARTE